MDVRVKYAGPHYKYAVEGLRSRINIAVDDMVDGVLFQSGLAMQEVKTTPDREALAAALSLDAGLDVQASTEIYDDEPVE